MGTRTYSRRGVLTAAGRRRAGLEAIDIFGEKISPIPAQKPIVETSPNISAPEPIKNVPSEQTESAKQEVSQAQKEKTRLTVELKKAEDEVQRITDLDMEYQRKVFYKIQEMRTASIADRTRLEAEIKRNLRELGYKNIDELRAAREQTVFVAMREAKSRVAKLKKQLKQVDNEVIVESSPINFGKRPDTARGIVRPQGPIKIDMQRMSPQEVYERIEKYINEKNPRPSEFYTALFASMRHPNAAKQTVEGSASMQNIVNEFYGIFDAARIKSAGVLQFKNDGLRRGTGGNYRASTHTITLPRGAPIEDVIHEIAHSVQSQFSVDASTQKWAKHRIKGEEFITSAQLPGGSIRTSGTRVMYRDHVDNPYTLMEDGLQTIQNARDKNYVRFREVFPMAIGTMPTANKSRDKQLFMTFIRSVQDANGYHN